MHESYQSPKVWKSKAQQSQDKSCDVLLAVLTKCCFWSLLGRAHPLEQNALQIIGRIWILPVNCAVLMMSANHLELLSPSLSH